jgi:uncharacterized protein (DUF433 family)
MATATINWSQCSAVDSVRSKHSRTRVFKKTRMPVATVFENLEAGSEIEEIVQQFQVTRERIRAVLTFAAPRVESPPSLLPKKHA